MARRGAAVARADGCRRRRTWTGRAVVVHLAGRPHPTVRRMLLDMIEEYARHTGHADLLREAVDGRVGEGAPPDFSF
ncbi:DUF664 domain-containing protein [Micromonospora sp. BRA006-A]|nr:DUF664 domain-containing protein [Micromonospora sp. BRA006-A]